ncbi:MAG: site-2 protease family protein [Lachnospiraceae bacterium]|nr:site-2 protease family protein [Lachnospiraceae bacterium]
MNIFLAILVFSIIVIVHEFGHFIVAKINKVGVIEFSLGMGPRLITLGNTPDGRRLLFLKKSKYFEEHPEYNDNTLYSWKLLPFGGSCMMLGEEEEVEDERAFGKKSVYARMAIIFAGPFFNFILAFILALIVIGFGGYDTPVVDTVTEGMPMEAAGIQPGDVITEINGRDILLSRELAQYLQFYPLSDEPVHLAYERNGVEKEITVTPEIVKGTDGTSEYKLGFVYNQQARTKVSGISVVTRAAYEVKYWIFATIESLGQMIQGKVSPKDIAGPVGIVQVVGKAVENTKSSGLSVVTLMLLNISILLTANLGVMNLLPIPALDGGRLLFLIIEWIRRKPLNQKIENYVNVTGFMLLMGLMVLILVNDVIKLF